MTVPVMSRDEAAAAVKAAVAGPADLGPRPADRAGRSGQRGPAEDLVMTGPAVNPVSSVRVNPMDSASSGKMVNVMVRRFR